jgi:outer membrane receptor protein involved in Fe transport
MATATLLSLFLVLRPGDAGAGTTGKISGTVLDASSQPIPGVTVFVFGKSIGAFTDTQGHYDILNVPPGTHEIRFTHIAFRPLTYTGILVSADQTTRLDAKLESTTVSMEAIEIKAERPIIDVNLTSARSTVTSEQIEALPVQDLNDVVNLQAGVVDGHVRGGRIGEVQYQIDGVSVNNPFSNESTLRIDRSLLQEVQVISGVFDAEYGQAMSGVVNAVLKDGTKDFRWSGEASGSRFVFDGAPRKAKNQIYHTLNQNYRVTLSGPLGAPSTVILLSGRRYIFDDYLMGRKVFRPTDQSDFERNIFRGTGDGSKVALGYTREWSGLGKLTNTSIKNVTLSYQAIFNLIEGRRADYAFRLNPDGLSKQKTNSVTHGLDITHTLNAATYYKLSLRQNYLSYTDLAFDSLTDPGYVAAGRAIGDPGYELGAIVQGVQFARWMQKTNEFFVTGSFVSQATRTQLLKVGGEIHLPDVKFGAPGLLYYSMVDGVNALVRFHDNPPTYRPIMGAVYAQDQIEWEDLTIRVGLRTEYFDARSSVPGDLANPANTILGAPITAPKSTSTKITVAPRLGVAYPISDRAGLHFAYGHFYQYPALGDIFTNADYSVLENLQAGAVSYGVMGNPDVRPEKTVQYELGYKYAFTEDFGAELNIFYKDIRNLLGSAFINTYNGAQYARLSNSDFADAIGFTMVLDHRRLGPVSTALDYTWQRVEGNASDPMETATRAEAGEDPRPRQIPLGWDQHHTLNVTISAQPAQGSVVSMIVRVASGQPYTPQLDAGFGNGLETNSGRKPSGLLIDLRTEQSMEWQGMSLGLFGRVFNLLDTRFFNGMVFSSTGSPDYSRFTETDKNALVDPLRYYAPRRIEIGLKFEPMTSE